MLCTIPSLLKEVFIYVFIDFSYRKLNTTLLFSVWDLWLVWALQFPMSTSGLLHVC